MAGEVTVRPQQRDPRPGDEEGERPAEGAELARTALSLPKLPGERERGGGDDEVQREEQVRLRRPDRDRNPRRRAGEHGDRKRPRDAEEEPREQHRRKHADDGREREHAVVTRGREREREHAAADGPADEADEPPCPRGAHREQREPERAEHRSDEGELGSHLTTTSAVAPCPAPST